MNIFSQKNSLCQRITSFRSIFQIYAFWVPISAVEGPHWVPMKNILGPRANWEQWFKLEVSHLLMNLKAITVHGLTLCEVLLEFGE